MEVPAISVIVPLYNVEKYVGECLDSILNQTLQDFEVIVVDDCSTDSSRAIVQSYVEKFSGRLTLVKTKRNTGGAGFPRNKGMEFSRGEYIYFIDPDDAITLTALEELYTLAKKFDADVVHCEKWYEVPAESWSDAEFRKNIKPVSYPAREKIFITKPTLLSVTPEKRVAEFCNGWLAWSVCSQLIRRDFIFANGIRFQNCQSEDMVFTICEICCAERYLVVPNVIYYYRLREGSAMRSYRNLSQQIHRQIWSLKNAVKYLDEFLMGTKFFASRADLRYCLIETLSKEILSYLDVIYIKIPAPALDVILRKEFGGEDVALTSFIFNLMNVQRLKLTKATRQVRKFNQFAAQTQARIDELQARIVELETALRNRS